MIGYICKYTPVKIIEALGETPVSIEPQISDFDHADTLLHSNMCTYSKAILEEMIHKKIDKVVLMNCCDSIRRLYDVIRRDPRFTYVYFLDLPQKSNAWSQELFYAGVKKFIRSLEKEFQASFDTQTLAETFEKSSIRKETENKPENTLNLALMGARYTKGLMDLIQEYDVHIKYNLSCTESALDVVFPKQKDPLQEYCKQLLNQYPCMRMVETENRHHVMMEDKNIHGIIYHTIKFCDYYGYDFSDIRAKNSLPLLKIETDATPQSQGQLKTRIEAFIESLKTKRPFPTSVSSSIDKSQQKKWITAGIDIGSTSANVVILDSYKNIVSYSIVKTGAKSIAAAVKALDEALKKAGLHRKDLDYIVSTGYGRISIPFADEEVTEITCHGKGAYFIRPGIKTIIDIGGQDSKAIRLDSMGNVQDFAMNDKCAAGTGRFLDMISKTLEIDISKVGQESLKWKNEIAISSMCAVFAESEIISLIAKNTEKADILHGLCHAIAGKTTGLINRVGQESPYMMTGGVAKNQGIIKCLEEKLENKIFIPEEPQIVGALGAALIALEKVSLF